jgi:feruloyl esterase
MTRQMGTITRLALCLLLGTAAAWAEPVTLAASSPVDRCESLAKADFSSLSDAPTAISTAKHISSMEELLRPLDDMTADLLPFVEKSLARMRPFCRVSGYVAPNVGFLMVLPDSGWNGKFLHLGCGGWCGDTRWFAALCALHPEYACVGTDMGHTGEGGLWLRNNLQAQIDFSYRATHVVTLAAKAIVERYYGQHPRKSYFMGCSTGGYQALTEAQRFPWDFDGIIAGAPDMDEADLAVRGIWIKQHFIGPDGKPILDAGALQLLHQAALARCATGDDLKHGIVGDPVRCQFDPAVLQCRGMPTRGCLTAARVSAARSIYGAPVTSDGKVLSSRGVFPGSELNWTEDFAHVWGEEFFKDTGILTVPGRDWTFRDFDFDRDYPRSGAGVLFNDTDPDLRQFKRAGGKLLVYQGGNDTGEIPGAIVDYHETVNKTMGGPAATDDFFRFFIIPGMNHCGGGDGAFAFDYLSYLEAWVERGTAPDVMTGAHVEGLGKYGWLFLSYPLDPSFQVAFTRSVSPYPKH